MVDVLSADYAGETSPVGCKADDTGVLNSRSRPREGRSDRGYLCFVIGGDLPCDPRGPGQ